MTWYSTQSHYPDTVPTSPCSIYPNNVECLLTKQQVSILKSLIRLDRGNLTTSIMTWYPTQSHYPDTQPPSPCSVLIMPSACLGNDRYQFLSHWSDSTREKTHEHRILRSPQNLANCGSFVLVPSWSRSNLNAWLFRFFLGFLCTWQGNETMWRMWT